MCMCCSDLFMTHFSQVSVKAGRGFSTYAFVFITRAEDAAADVGPVLPQR